MNSRRKPRVAVFKFASCDGCQLSLLDTEDELLAVAEAVDIAYFPEASRNMRKGPYDLGLVEGSITTHHDADRIQQVRRECRVMATLGACATAGGIQALRNWRDSSEFVSYVYMKPDFIQTLKTSTPIAEHVPVDYELRGCPINKAHLVELISAILAGRKPNLPTYSVCVECKRRGNICIAVAKGVDCIGPATQAGCGAICPAFGRGCYGCFGPAETTANGGILAAHLAQKGRTNAEIRRQFRSFNAWAWPFRQATEERGSQ